MKTIVLSSRYDEVLVWLMENIGPMLHSQPIIFWHGDGWHMKQHTRFTKSDATNILQGKPVSVPVSYEVEFTDDDDALWCALMWA